MLTLTFLLLTGCSDTDGQIAECRCLVSETYGSDDETVVLMIYDIDECAAPGASAQASVKAQCESDWARWGEHYDDLACSCSCIYTDDGCYLQSSSSGGNDTGWAR